MDSPVRCTPVKYKLGKASFRTRTIAAFRATLGLSRPPQKVRWGVWSEVGYYLFVFPLEGLIEG